MNIPSHLGDLTLLQDNPIAFLCSHHVAVGTTEVVLRWVEQLPQNSTVLCGNLTGIEQLVLRRLQERSMRIVLALATAIEQRDYQVPLVISPTADPNDTVPTGKNAAERNKLMISLSKQIVVGFMSENGNLAQQLLTEKNVCLLHQQDRADAALPHKDAGAEQMGWAIYRKLQDGQPTSLEMRQLLARYLQLDIEKPSLLHSLILFAAIKHYGHCADFNFTAFLRLWDIRNFRPEDWKSQKNEETKQWTPSLVERATARLFKALPSKYHPKTNPDETFDPQTAHALVDTALCNTPKNKRMLKRALSLAYYERNSERIAHYKSLLDSGNPQPRKGKKS